MPLPKPRKGETKDDFHGRCMGDETARRDFPDQAQRNAVCFRQWDDEHPENPHPTPKKGFLIPPQFSEDLWPEPGTTVACWSNHLGLWAIEALWFTQAVASWRGGMWPPKVASWHQPPMPIQAAERQERRPYPVMDSVAIVPLMGPMTRGGSEKFDGVSTVRTQRALRQAAHDEGVQRILLHINSPGGHVDGVGELADEMLAARQVKPVYAHIDGLGASAAYWVASQAEKVSASPYAEVGSIGTIAVLEDSSKRLERLGVQVHVISTGPYKGIGMDGVPVSEETLAYLRGRVEAINQQFLGALRRGRYLTEAQVSLVSDGRVHIAETARALGLVDSVQSFDATLDALRGTQATRGYLRTSATEQRLQRVLAATQRNDA